MKAPGNGLLSSIKNFFPKIPNVGQDMAKTCCISCTFMFYSGDSVIGDSVIAIGEKNVLGHVAKSM